MASTLSLSEPNTPPHFSLQDVEAFNKLNSQQFSQLVDILFTYLSNATQIDKFYESLDAVAEAENLNVASLKELMKTLMFIARVGIRENHTDTQFDANIHSFGFEQEKKNIFVAKWLDNRDALAKSAIDKIITINQLVDLEWKFGVTAATSEADKVGNIFLQLKLTIDKGNKLEEVFMELTLPQFYAFLHEMEKAKASLEYFSS